MSSTVMPRVRARRVLHAVSASAAAIAAGLAMPAHAQCVPNPAQGTTTTTCSGTEPNGLDVRGGPTVNLTEGAIVQAPAGGASAISVTTDGSSPTFATINVASTAQIAGPIGVDVASSGFYTRAEVVLDNSGTITSTSGGYALRGSETASGRFETIRNRADGVIGAIHAQVGTLTNEGLIDGGALSAFSDVGGSLQYYGQGEVVNSGTIRSSGSADTIFFSRSFNSGTYVTNSGLIENVGSGRAVGGQTLMYLVNQADGRIVAQQTGVGASAFVDVGNFGTITGNGDAIASGGSLNLVNRGTINGIVRVAQYSSTIDNRGGTINGSLLLGDGDDVFIGDANDFANPIGTITGVLNAGAGNDVLRFTFTEDTILDTAIPLPATIERLGLRIGNSSTLTLSETFAGSNTLYLGGGDENFFNTKNQFVLNGSIITQGPAILSDGSAPGGFGVTNNGTISAALTTPGDFAVSLSRVRDFTNTGTITASGGGGVLVNGDYRMSNSGTITADGTAVSARYVASDNSGTIRSLHGIGLTLEGSGSTTSINSGLIEGDVAGARVYYTVLRNSGTISSAQNGVEIGISGVVENLAGGVIRGGAKGVAPSTAYSQVQSARVVNGGTIDGDVDFGEASGPYGSSNVFIALSGSRVNGDIHLGSGRDTFVTTLINDGPGEFAGLTGQVTGSGQETLRYLVDADASATPRLEGIFSALGYELSNDAKLTLVSPTLLDFNLGFAGTGTVDLTADMSGRGDGVLLDLHQTALQTGADRQPLPTAIDLTSRGTITVTKDPALTPFVYSQAAVSLGIGDTFTNAGLLTASAMPPPQNSGLTPFAAIRTLGGTVVNLGTIRIDGATAILGSTFYSEDVASVVNSGVIEQLPGAVQATGIAGVRNVTNTGVIRTGGPAIAMTASTRVINSGTLSSAQSSAIQANGFQPGSVDNQQGGSITGGAGLAAIHLAAGSIVQNSGTITGDVVLDYHPYGWSSTGTSIYVNRGGTLTGSLTLSDGDDIFIALGGETGVSGSIVTGLGLDTFAVGYDSSASVDLDTLAGGRPDGFERSGVGAYGSGTTVTLAGASRYDGALLLVGDGTIVNTGTINTAPVESYDPAGYLRLGALTQFPALGAGSSLEFINEGRIENGVAGSARVFDNRGYVGANPVYGTAVSITANAEGLTWRNAGVVAGETSISQASTSGRVAQLTFDNSGSLEGGIDIQGAPDRFTFINSGRIDSSADYGQPVIVSLAQYRGAVNASEAAFVNDGVLYDGLTAAVAAARVTFSNSGTIGHADSWPGLSLSQTGLRQEGQTWFDEPTLDQESFAFVNSGSILTPVTLSSRAPSVTIENSGSVASAGTGVYMDSAFGVRVASSGDQSVSFLNSGSIATTAPGTAAVSIATLPLTIDGTSNGATTNASITLTNSGTIRADGGATFVPAGLLPYVSGDMLLGLTALNIVADGAGNGEVTIVNQAGATISAAGTTKAAGQPGLPTAELPSAYESVGSLAVSVTADKLTLTNAGTIIGAKGGLIPSETALVMGASFSYAPLTDHYFAGAIQTFGSVDSITNASTGTIVGSIHLGAGDDRLENSGLLQGTSYLGLGDDVLTLVAGGVIDGLVDGGDGTDAVRVLASGDGSVAAASLAGFESLSQSGTGSIAYSGTFGVDTIGLAGSNLRVDAGTALATAGATTVTGTADRESVTVAGTLAGAIALGDGDDRFSEIGEGRATGSVDAGAGRDLYALTLSGDRAGVSQVSGFEELAVDGNGTLTLDKSFELVSLAGTSLVVGNGGGAGAIQGSAAAERVTSAIDLARVALGGGDDRLSLGATVLGGVYLGEAGSDMLVLTADQMVRLDGTLSGFEQIASTSGALAVAGTFGAAGETASLGEGAQRFTLLAGGRLLGTVDLAGGDDQLRVEGGTLDGRVEGGAGTDVATIALTGDTTLAPVLGGFEQLRTEGTGSLSLTQGAFQFDRVAAATDLRIAADASLTAPQLVFGARDDRLTIAGGFTGSVAGGAGSDTLTVSGGTAASPIRFASISEIETFMMLGGDALLSGQAQLGAVSLNGGRFTGLAGSTLTASSIAVGPGATFGSAGTVNAALAIGSGAVFSPGASPAVMTVNGNVSLSGGSNTLFEFVPAPGQSDQLLINGNLTIAPGAILNLTGNRPLTPGVAYDMIVANSITGQFTIGTWDRNAVRGFLRYLDTATQDRLQLLGTFVSVDPLPGAAGAAVTYVNDLLVSGQASSALLNSVNALLDSNGFASAQAFGQLSPEVYASAMQLGSENGLVIAKAGRSGVMNGAGERPAPFTFGSGTGAWRTLDAVSATGASGVKSNVHEVLGGIGYGNAKASLSAFVGYLDGEQRIAALGAKTDADGMVAGVSGHVALGGLQLHALVSYDWSSADTSRAAPGGATVSSGYDLNSLVLDAVASYDLPLGQSLVITPAVGITHIATDRDSIRESGSAAFALDVDGDTHAATFIDGAIALRGSPTASIRPWAEIGVRYQLDGELPRARAGFVGMTGQFIAPGVSRQQTVITYGAGLEASVGETVSLFAGYRGESGDGSGSNVTGGVRLRF